MTKETSPSPPVLSWRPTCPQLEAHLTSAGGLPVLSSRPTCPQLAAVEVEQRKAFLSPTTLRLTCRHHPSQLQLGWLCICLFCTVWRAASPFSRELSFQTCLPTTQYGFLGTPEHGQGKPGPTGRDPTFYPNCPSRRHLRWVTFLPQPLGSCALSPLFTHHAVCFPFPIVLTISAILPPSPLSHPECAHAHAHTHMQNPPSTYFLYFIKILLGVRSSSSWNPSLH